MVEFHSITKTLKSNEILGNKCSFKKYLEYHITENTEKLKRLTGTLISYVQGVSEIISQILAQVDIGVALKPHNALSSLFSKPKDVINFEQKRGLVYQMSCRYCNAMHV